MCNGKIWTGPLPPEIAITIWRTLRKSRHGRQVRWVWNDLVEHLRSQGAEVRAKRFLEAPGFFSVRECCEPDNCNAAKKEQLVLPHHRCDAAVVSISAICFDHDHKPGSEKQRWDTVVSWCEENGLAAILYETTSHMVAVNEESEEGPRWRVVLPLAAPWTTIDTWPETYALFRRFLEETTRVKFDASCRNPSRVFFPPSRPSRKAPARQVLWVPGDALDLVETASRIRSAKRARDEHPSFAKRQGPSQALRAAVAAVASALPGSRNDTLNRMAFRVFRSFVAEGKLDDREVQNELRRAAKSAGLDDEEIDRTLDSAAAAASVVPRLEPHASDDSAPEEAVGCTVIERRSAILVSVEEKLVNDQAILALAHNDDAVWQREPGRLVTVQQLGARTPKGLRAAPETLTVRPLPKAVLRERLAAAAEWYKYSRRNEDYVRCHVPGWTVAAVLDRRAWNDIPWLRGVVEYPVLRPDRTLLRTPGYDPESGLYLGGTATIRVPPKPTREHAMRAVAFLVSLVTDFPFKDAQSRSAWVCGLLTPIARYAFDGPTPLFIVTANIRGAGKTLLVDLIGRILTGREMPAQTMPASDEELEKVLVGVAMSGLPMLNFDNASGSIGGGVLDKWLTSRRPTGRLLGSNESLLQFSWETVLYVTANNASIHGDTDRRSTYIVLESDHEAPELRTDFAIGDITEHVRQNRGRLLSAALVILRAYEVAGSPAVDARHKGSFEGWSRTVRDAVVWAGMEDPERALDDPQRPEDRDREVLRLLLDGWWNLAGRDPMTVSQAFRALGFDANADPKQADLGLNDGGPDLAPLREAVLEIDPRTKPSPKKVGTRLRQLCNRWLDDRRLVRGEDRHSKVSTWRVESRRREDAE